MTGSKKIVAGTLASTDRKKATSGRRVMVSSTVLERLTLAPSTKLIVEDGRLIALPTQLSLLDL